MVKRCAQAHTQEQEKAPGLGAGLLVPTPELSLAHLVPVSFSILLFKGVSRTVHAMQLCVIKSLERGNTESCR